MSNSSDQNISTPRFVYFVLSIASKDGGVPEVLKPLYIALHTEQTPKLSYNFSTVMSHGKNHDEDEISYIGAHVNRNTAHHYIHFTMPTPGTIFGSTYDAKDEIIPESRRARGVVSMSSNNGLVNGHFNIFYADDLFHENCSIPFGHVLPQCFHLLDILESKTVPSDDIVFGITIIDSGVCDELPGELLV